MRMDELFSLVGLPLYDSMKSDKQLDSSKG